MRRHLMTAAACALLAAGFSCSKEKLVTIAELTDTFTQGTGAQNTLNFKQNSALVDVLFVVDNSPSMCEKQQALAQKFQAFIAAFEAQQMDFHVGVVSTDMYNPTFQGKLVAKAGNPTFVTGATPNLSQVFAENLAEVGLGGSPRSQGLLAAQAALTEPLAGGANTGFLRGPEASLAIIVVSDEDDFSLADPPAKAADDYMATYFARLFDGLKGPGNDGLISLSAIVGADDQGKPANCKGTGTKTQTCIAKYSDLDGHAAVRTADVAVRTGGLAQSICAKDFGPLLTTIADHIGGMLRSYNLTNIPLGQALDPKSIKINVLPPNGQPFTVPASATDGWSYDEAGHTILFKGTGLPPPNSEVTISYLVLTKSFKLTEAPEVSTIVVTETLNGQTATVPATSSDPLVGWTFDSTLNAVVFAPNSIPPAGAVVDITYNF